MTGSDVGSNANNQIPYANHNPSRELEKGTHPTLTNQGNLLQQTLGLGNLIEKSIKHIFLLLIHKVISLSDQYRKHEARHSQKVLHKLRRILRQDRIDTGIVED